ncbi:hypothetical protein PENSPDRAFT_658141 [Peniophora sp. CONT]|nr:hypothetical protein PENSPDRAFT_658141 [Peniophora sp. CONT]
MSSPIARPSAARTQDLVDNLAEIRDRVRQAAGDRLGKEPTLVAVSKYKPPADILACYDVGQRDFGENYVQELVDKAEALPKDIRWHFIGTLQSNKAKILASIPNIAAVQTVTSAKAATGLNKSLPADRTDQLSILLQVNTSGEEAKSGLPASGQAESELAVLARHVLDTCPRLRLAGLMTIGSLDMSVGAGDENQDFKTLIRVREELQENLRGQYGQETWGDGTGTLRVSMGMSSDFEAALRSGSDIVRVGTGIFGERHKKGEAPP